MIDSLSAPMLWPAWRKILFRFFFIYLMLIIAPWTWLHSIPGVNYILQYYYIAIDWAVELSNKYAFHVRPALIQPNGSGDTSWSWTQVWLYLSVAFAGCIVWSVLDRRREQYDKADYWLRTFIRYFVSLNALSYGIYKLFAVQMFFPTLSQLATPLGDFLPMRLSWMFMGYSTTYQMFAGAMEVVAGLLLLNRKTVTLGLLVASGVFANVLAMNLSYDIPVKIFSGHLLFYCIYLLAHDWQRLFKAFVLNEPSIPTNLYAFNYSSKKMRVGRIIAKLLFIGIALLYQFYSVMEYAHSSLTQVELKPVKPGIYDVKTFVLNHDTIPALASDSLRWKDIVFDYGGQGSVNSTDTVFRQRYRRGYFVYKPDTTAKSISILRRDVTGAEKPLFAARYELTAGNGMKLWAKVRSDSVYVELALSKRRFQLAERQFHWLSEYNR